MSLGALAQILWAMGYKLELSAFDETPPHNNHAPTLEATKVTATAKSVSATTASATAVSSASGKYTSNGGGTSMTVVQIPTVITNFEQPSKP